MMAATHDTGGRLMVGLCIAALAGIAFWAVVTYTGQPDRNDQLNPDWKYDMAAVNRIDPQLIEYEQIREIPTGVNEPRGIDVAEGTLYIAGDGNVVVIPLISGTQGNIGIDFGIKSATVLVEDHRTIYVADKTRVVLPHTSPKAPPGCRILATLDDGAVITSLAVTEQYLFVADAGNRVVWRFERDDFSKTPLKVGEKSDVTGAPGLVVPSPYMDILIDRNGLLRVVNPGKLRVETFSFDGDYGRDSAWGQSGPGVTDFVGCCNPAHIAQLPDGRFVTSEKGSPRVKIYSETGEFECVVAGPDEFSDKAKNLDLATDADGRIYVLDPVRKSVRVFAKKEGQ